MHRKSRSPPVVSVTDAALQPLVQNVMVQVFVRFASGIRSRANSLVSRSSHNSETTPPSGRNSITATEPTVVEDPFASMLLLRVPRSSSTKDLIFCATEQIFKQAQEKAGGGVSISTVLPSPFLEDYGMYVALGDGTVDQSHREEGEGLGFAYESCALSDARMSIPYMLVLLHRKVLGRKDSTLNFTASEAFSSGEIRSSLSLADAVEDSIGALHRSLKKRMETRTLLPVAAAQRRQLGQSTAGGAAPPATPPVQPQPSAQPPTPQSSAVLQPPAPSAPQKMEVPEKADEAEDDVFEGAEGVERLMHQCGLTVYDLAKHGCGAQAETAKLACQQQSVEFLRADLERRRQDNLLRRSELARRREEESLDTSRSAVLSVREKYLEALRKQKNRESMTSLEVTQERDVQQRERQLRELQLEKKVEEMRAALMKEEEDAARRRGALATSVDALVDRRETDRRQREKQHLLGRASNLREPTVDALYSASRRPQLKKMEVQMRQAKILEGLMSSLDQKCVTDAEAALARLDDAQKGRRNDEQLQQNESIVKSVEQLRHEGIRRHRAQRHRERERRRILQSQAPVVDVDLASASYVLWGQGAAATEKQDDQRYATWMSESGLHAEAQAARAELCTQRRHVD